jgi:flagellar basal-body rod protein FlgF
MVLGEGGAPITLPPDRTYLVGKDGTINAIDPANGQVEAVGRLRLVNPPVTQLQRGDDGLFRLPAGTPPPPEDPTVSVRGGYLEKSNVDVVDQMVRMIALARQFEMNTKAIQVAEEDDQRATALLSPR